VPASAGPAAVVGGGLGDLIVVQGSTDLPHPHAFLLVHQNCKQYMGRPPASDICKGPYALSWVDPADGKEVQVNKQPKGCNPMEADFERADIICNVDLDSRSMLTWESVRRIAIAFQSEPESLEKLLPSWARELGAPLREDGEQVRPSKIASPPRAPPPPLQKRKKSIRPTHQRSGAKKRRKR
jgi:hypothetical protein